MKNRLHLVIVTFVLIVVSSCSTPTPENAQIQRLNRQVEEQQKQIDQLRRAIASFDQTSSTRQVEDEREEPSSSQPQTDSAGWKNKQDWQKIEALRTGSFPSTGWKDKQNWQKIQDNMSSQQVIAILGQPTGEEKAGSYLTLLWEGNVPGSGYVSGNVLFSHNQASVIKAPVFLNQ